MITKESYVFVEHKGEEDWYVKIKDEGPYKGIIYKYGRIEVKEDELQEQAHLTFQFDVTKIPEELHIDKEELQHDVTFMNMLGDILTNIIEDAMESGKYKLGKNDKPTDTESTVHE